MSQWDGAQNPHCTSVSTGSLSSQEAIKANEWTNTPWSTHELKNHHCPNRSEDLIYGPDLLTFLFSFPWHSLCQMLLSSAGFQSQSKGSRKSSILRGTRMLQMSDGQSVRRIIMKPFLKYILSCFSVAAPQHAQSLHSNTGASASCWAHRRRCNYSDHLQVEVCPLRQVKVELL